MIKRRFHFKKKHKRKKLTLEQKDKLYDMCRKMFWYSEGKLIKKKYNGKGRRIYEVEKEWEPPTMIRIGKDSYTLAQIIYLICTKIFPDKKILYKDGNSKNKRIENMILPPNEKNYLENPKINKTTWYDFKGE